MGDGAARGDAGGGKGNSSHFRRVGEVARACTCFVEAVDAVDDCCTC